MKKVYLSLMILLSIAAKAQQDAMFTQYMFNPISINPGYVGSNEALTFTGLFRRQWVGMDGAPTTGTFSIDAPLRRETMGLGLNIVADKIGISSTLGAFASYAYRLKVSEKGKLALGVQVGVSQYTANLSGVVLDNANDNAFNSGNLSLLQPNIGLGLYYSDNKFFVGLSAPHLINNQLNKNYQFLSSTDAGLARQYKHYFFTTGYSFDLSDDVLFKPSVLVKAVAGAPVQLDANASVWLYEKLGLGLSWRSFSSANLLLGFHATPQITLGYSYDFSTSALRSHNAGSHEIALRYQLKNAKGKVVSPRFF